MINNVLPPFYGSQCICSSLFIGVARGALGAIPPPGRRKKLLAKFTSAPPGKSKSTIFEEMGRVGVVNVGSFSMCFEGNDLKRSSTKRHRVDRQNIQITQKYLFICMHICLLYNHTVYIYVHWPAHKSTNSYNRSKMHIFITNIHQMCNYFKIFLQNYQYIRLSSVTCGTLKPNSTDGISRFLYCHSNTGEHDSFHQFPI